MFSFGHLSQQQERELGPQVHSLKFAVGNLKLVFMVCLALFPTKYLGSSLIVSEFGNNYDSNHFLIVITFYWNILCIFRIWIVLLYFKEGLFYIF